MTDRDKYDILLKSLAEVLRSKNETIMFQKYEIEKLKAKIDEIRSKYE